MADLTSTSTSSLPAWLQPYAAGYINRAQTVSDSPYQAYTGQLIAGANPYQTQGWDAQAQRAMQGSPVMGAANNTLQSVIQGDFLKGNPYLDAQITAAQGDLTKSWNNVQKPAWERAMQGSGSFGNSGIMQANASGQDTLQQNLGRIGSDMRFNAYNTERGYQQQALGMAPQFANQDYVDIQKLQDAGAQYQGQQQKELTSDYAQFLESRNYPQQQLDTFGNALGKLNWGGTQTNTQPGASTGASLLGGGLTGAAIYKMLFGG